LRAYSSKVHSSALIKPHPEYLRRLFAKLRAGDRFGACAIFR
jgi:hypothetical protein